MYRNSQLIRIFFLGSWLIAWSYYGISQVGNDITLRTVPISRHFETDEYKGGIQSWSFDQDSTGILYVANNEGLLEFDGSTWTKYIVPACTKVRAVLVDKQNRIFVGGQGQIGYFQMTETGLAFKSLLEYLPPEYQNVAETWKILEYDQRVYFVTESELCGFDGRKINVKDNPGQISMAFHVSDKLLVQYYQQGLFEVVDDKLIYLNGTREIPAIVSILQSDDGIYCFCRSGQLFELKDSGLQEIDLPVNSITINAVIRLRSGEYTIGTQNKGLYILNKDLTFKQHLTKNKGLSDRTVRSIFEDDHHNLWVALNNGIEYLETSLPFSLINEEVGLEGTGYAACVYKDQYYFGTNNGLFIEQPAGRTAPYIEYKLMPGSEGQVYNFSLIEHGLILNHNNGAYQILEDKLEHFHYTGSWKFIETRVLGLFLCGDYRGISYFRRKNSEWSYAGFIEGFFESSRILEFENDSTLWMTHGSKGAFRIKFDQDMRLKGEIEHYGERHGFPSNSRISVYSLSNNLVFTGERGIYNFDNEGYTFLPNSFFNKWLGADHVSALASDNSNTIYFIQNNEIGVLIQESFETYRKETGLFKHINKFINDDLPNITLIDNRTVLIGAKEGFIRYNPLKTFSPKEEFKVLLRTVKVRSASDSSVTYNPAFIENKEISRSQSIIFRYAAPYFDGFEDLKYSYRLLPMDEYWSQWSPKSEKEFSYLPARTYTFEVKALNVYGTESSVTSFTFKVLKPWYASNIAIAAYFVGGLIIIFIVLLIQRNKHRVEKSILKKSKEQALKEKNEQIDQISQESKKEIDRLINEKLRTEIDLKNDQLTTITMQLMNNNQAIKDALRKIESQLDEGGSNQEMKRIIKDIDKDISNKDSWDQFAYHFDQVHGDYLKKLSKNNVKLSPREIKLAAFLRMNMSTKEISKMMNITERSVELARHRLRKKLKLERDQNLVEYLIELDNQ